MLADLALVGGKIITMNPSQSSAEAIAIKEDIILNVGSNEEINSYIGEKTKIIDLKGKTVVPGFIDCHIHIADYGKFLTWLDFKGVNSIGELQEKIRQRDEYDSTRENSPLAKAPDAHYIDTTQMTIDEVCNHIITHVNEE